MKKPFNTNSRTQYDMPCRKCGHDVFWDTNRNGKRYLAMWCTRQYEDGRGRWKQPHFCSEHEIASYTEQLALWEAQQAQAIASGEIVAGQRIVVVKGRKVPLGVEGTVFWVAPEANNWGVISVGFKTDAGDKHFTNITNVKAVELTK